MIEEKDPGFVFFSFHSGPFQPLRKRMLGVHLICLGPRQRASTLMHTSGVQIFFVLLASPAVFFFFFFFFFFCRTAPSSATSLSPSIRMSPFRFIFCKSDSRGHVICSDRSCEQKGTLPVSDPELRAEKDQTQIGRRYDRIDRSIDCKRRLDRKWRLWGEGSNSGPMNSIDRKKKSLPPFKLIPQCFTQKWCVGHWPEPDSNRGPLLKALTF
jgi:hypothetical protein